MATVSLSRFALASNSVVPPEQGVARTGAAVDGATREALCLALTGLPVWAFAGPAPKAWASGSLPQEAGQVRNTPALETAARKWLCLS